MFFVISLFIVYVAKSFGLLIGSVFNVVVSISERCVCTLAPHHEGVWGSENKTPCILEVGNGWRWSSSKSSCFIPRERSHCTNWIGGYVGTGAGLEEEESETSPKQRF
jgi:hypothetical protein